VMTEPPYNAPFLSYKATKLHYAFVGAALAWPRVVSQQLDGARRIDLLVGIAETRVGGAEGASPRSTVLSHSVEHIAGHIHGHQNHHLPAHHHRPQLNCLASLGLNGSEVQSNSVTSQQPSIKISPCGKPPALPGWQ